MFPPPTYRRDSSLQRFPPQVGRALLVRRRSAVVSSHLHILDARRVSVFGNDGRRLRRSPRRHLAEVVAAPQPNRAENAAVNVEHGQRRDVEIGDCRRHLLFNSNENDLKICY